MAEGRSNGKDGFSMETGLSALPFSIEDVVGNSEGSPRSPAKVTGRASSAAEVPTMGYEGSAVEAATSSTKYSMPPKTALVGSTASCAIVEETSPFAERVGAFAPSALTSTCCLACFLSTFSLRNLRISSS